MHDLQKAITSKHERNRKRTSQRQLSRKMFHTDRELAEMEMIKAAEADENLRPPAWAKFSHYSPNPDRKDPRVGTDVSKVEHAWKMVQRFRHRNFLLLNLLSLLTKQYYLESTVQAVVTKHPEAIFEQLHLAEQPIDGVAQKALAHYTYESKMNEFYDRIEVKTTQSLMTRCVTHWVQNGRPGVHNFHNIDVYIVPGRHGPKRPLLLPRERGVLGGCQLESRSLNTTTNSDTI